MKKWMLVIMVLVCGSWMTQAQKPEIFSKDGFAIRGYDAVAYFQEQKPVKGLEQISYKWNDAVWIFASEKNRDSFQLNPEKYAPQFGGYCAFGMSRGYKAPTSADAFSIVNGKLYLNYNTDVRTEWNKDQPGYIEKAAKNWVEVRKQ